MHKYTHNRYTHVYSNSLLFTYNQFVQEYEIYLYSCQKSYSFSGRCSVLNHWMSFGYSIFRQTCSVFECACCDKTDHWSCADSANAPLRPKKKHSIRLDYHVFLIKNSKIIYWLVVWNLEHFLFSHILGMSSSQLTKIPLFETPFSASRKSALKHHVIIIPPFKTHI